MDQWLQIGIQIPVVGLFTWFTLRVIRMFQERESKRDDARADERREMAEIVSNNTTALHQNTIALTAVVDVVRSQGERTEKVETDLCSVGDVVQYIRGKLDDHDTMVRERLDR